MSFGTRPRLVMTLCLIAMLLPWGAIAAPPACAGRGDRAALVVDTGGSVQSFCIALPDDEVSGLELIELANRQHGLTYKLGFGGEAVCMLAGVGPTSDDCFEQYPDFWGYWRGDGSGGWTWSGTGAGSATVEDGDVEGWSWGSGSDGNTHPPPPATTLGDVCAAEAEPRPPTRNPGSSGDDPAAPRSGGGQAGRPPRPAPGPTAAVTGDRPAPTRGRKRFRPQAEGPTRERGSRTRSTSDRATEVAAARSPSAAALDEQPTAALEPVGPSGPPPAGLAALGAAALMGGAGVVMARRRRTGT